MRGKGEGERRGVAAEGESGPVPGIREESHIQGLKNGAIWLQHLVKGEDPGNQAKKHRSRSVLK